MIKEMKSRELYGVLRTIHSYPGRKRRKKSSKQITTSSSRCWLCSLPSAPWGLHPSALGSQDISWIANVICTVSCITTYSVVPLSQSTVKEPLQSSFITLIVRSKVCMYASDERKTHCCSRLQLFTPTRQQVIRRGSLQDNNTER